MSRTLLLLALPCLGLALSYTDSTELRAEVHVGSHGRNVVCYVSSWAAYRPKPGNFSLDELDPKICTHFVYAFAGLNETTSEIRSLDAYRDLEEDYGLGWYKKLTALKRKHPHLKVTLAVGGWNEGSPKYSKMSGDANLRKKFIDSVKKMLDAHDFDGLDLDWEFPANRDGKPEDKANFALLVKELRAALPNKILTAALGAGRHIIESAYDIPSISRDLDLLHVMAYDYHGTWDGKTGSNAPLQSRDSQDYLSIMSTIKLLKQLGAPARKLVLGVPTYGRTFLLKREAMGDNQQVQPSGDDAQDRGFQGPYTREDGFMGYNEICTELQMANSEWRTMWDDVSKTPYAVNKDKWISYDDERSVAEKAKYAIEEDLGGVMVWAIDTDDFRGDCGHGETGMRYPLVRSLNSAMSMALEKQYEVSTQSIHPHHPSGPTEASGSGRASISALAAILVTLRLLW